MNSSTDLITDLISTVSSLTASVTTQTQKILEQTTESTGETLDWIASNPILKAADNIIGIDWLMTFLGRADTDKIRQTVAEIKIFGIGTSCRQHLVVELRGKSSTSALCHSRSCFKFGKLKLTFP